MYQQKQRIMAYMIKTYGSEPEQLWAKYPKDIVFRHSASRKWYAIIMGITWNKMGVKRCHNEYLKCEMRSAYDWLSA